MTTQRTYTVMAGEISSQPRGDGYLVSVLDWRVAEIYRCGGPALGKAGGALREGTDGGCRKEAWPWLEAVPSPYRRIHAR